MTPATPSTRPWPGALDWGGDWLAEAAAELAHLGFVLREGTHTGTVPGPRLLVALRAVPTLAHFDPEEATYWIADQDHGALARLDSATPLPVDRAFAWGRIRVTDRIPVSNQFLSFGGRLLAGAAADGAVLAAFVSRAPILRWAGHSQGVDPLTDDVGAFFARLMVPVDFQPGAEARILELDPEAFYAAFIEHAGRRMRPASRLRASEPEMARRVDHERARLARDAPRHWREGVELLDWLELG